MTPPANRLLACLVAILFYCTAHSEPYFAHSSGTMVYDQATNRVWARCHFGQDWDGSTCRGQPSADTFQSSIRRITQLNEQNAQGGYQDWRIPTVRELESLFWCSTGLTDQYTLQDGGRPLLANCKGAFKKPPVNSGAFPKTPEGGYHYWATDADRNADMAWAVAPDFKAYVRADLRKEYVYSSLITRLVRHTALRNEDRITEGFTEPLPDALQWDDNRSLQEFRARAAVEARKASEVAEATANQRQAREAAEKNWNTYLKTATAQRLYIDAGQHSARGDTGKASEVYQTIIRRFPDSEIAIKAIDQIAAIRRTEATIDAANRSENSQRETAETMRRADENASVRASCFSRVNICVARCRSWGGSSESFCVQGCQADCR